MSSFHTSLVVTGMVRKIARISSDNLVMTIASIYLFVKNTVKDCLLSETINVAGSFWWWKAASTCRSNRSIVLLCSR